MRKAKVATEERKDGKEEAGDDGWRVETDVELFSEGVFEAWKTMIKESIIWSSGKHLWRTPLFKAEL
jgi:hypothetical protein